MWIWFVLIAVLAAVVAVIIYLRSAVSRKCPECRKKSLQKTGMETVTTNRQLIEVNTYVCGNCGHTVNKHIIIAEVSEPGESGFGDN